MADYQMSALFGDQPNYSYLDAQRMSSTATGPDDWASVAKNGINALMDFKIRELVYNTQVKQGMNPGGVNLQASGGLMQILLIGGIAWFVLKG